eukprot:1003748-Prymnesium_polylepis.1
MSPGAVSGRYARPAVPLARCITIRLEFHFVLPCQSKKLACGASVNPLVSQQVSTKGWRRERTWLASTSTWAGR